MRKTFLLIFTSFFFAPLYAQTWQELDSIAIACFRKFEYAQADSFWLLAQRKIGQQDSDFGMLVFKRGDCAYYLQDYERAVGQYQLAARIYQNMGQGAIKEYLKALASTADTYKHLEQCNQPATLYLACLDTLKAYNLLESKEAGMAFNNIGAFYWGVGNYAKAEDCYMKSKNIKLKLLPEELSSYATTCNNIARLYISLGLYEQAKSLLLEAQSILQKNILTGRSSVTYETVVANLAMVQSKSKQYDEAEKYYLQALELRSKRLGTNHNDYSTLEQNLGLMYMSQLNFEKAELILTAVRDKKLQNAGKKHSEYASICRVLGHFYETQKQFSQAETLYIEALTALKEYNTSKKGDLRLTYTDFGRFYARQGKQEKALPLFREAYNLKQQEIKAIFPLLSESEKLGYYKSCYDVINDLVSSLLHEATKDKTLVGEVFDILLFSKAIVFSSVVFQNV
ncbi:MAG: tetratricopeptide repeat protein [Cytophagales bacterium]|nr:MAG: tetratricopeptide repeat protein [Cytophagales bacterium]TAF61556.1 MAG: tetratricopeptide repeat protein [Cytophagales bacterium]